MRHSALVPALLFATLLAAYALPKPRYEGTDVIPQLAIPTSFDG